MTHRELMKMCTDGDRGAKSLFRMIVIEAFDNMGANKYTELVTNGNWSITHAQYKHVARKHGITFDDVESKDALN